MKKSIEIEADRSTKRRYSNSTMEEDIDEILRIHESLGLESVLDFGQILTMDNSHSQYFKQRRAVRYCLKIARQLLESRETEAATDWKLGA